MDIGLIGFGGVGKAFIRLLIEKKQYLFNKYNLNIRIKYIIKSDGGIYLPDGINIEELVKFLDKENDIQNYKGWKYNKVNIDLIEKNKDIDTLIELTSTNIVNGQPGLSHIKSALENSINVVTGNKGPIVLEYKELKKIAVKNKVKLMVGCTTGGALPSISGGIYDVAGAEISSIEGILNGTSNFILTEMVEKEISYEKALTEAQAMGIAEANPKLDVEGFDTASKIIILSNILIGTDLKLKDIVIEGITDIDIEELSDLKTNNKKVKLLGKISKNGNEISAYVKPIIIDSTHSLYNVDGKNKGVLYKTDTLGNIAIIGGASGTTNAAASILRDVLIINGL